MSEVSAQALISDSFTSWAAQKRVQNVDFSNPAAQIAIVGGGVAGTLLAVHLLRQASPPFRILLMERNGECGRGVAYRTHCPLHLLNVAAGGMSVFPEDPDHFVRWLHAHTPIAGLPDYSAGDFVPRGLFGQYVQDVLGEARGQAAPGVVLDILPVEVVDLEERGDGVALRCRDGQVFEAERVVLAIGNLPGEYPIPRSLAFYETAHYVHVPWQSDSAVEVGADEDVLLVGHGLTATDLIVQLEHRGHRGTIHALSRRGMRPQVHLPGITPRSISDWADIPPTIRAWTRRVIIEVQRAEREGGDWRSVIDGLRPCAQEIWQSFSWEERSRFMRHVRPLWDVLRHRVPPSTAEVVRRVEADGRLKFYAGRLQALEAAEGAAHALIRLRGTINHLSLRVARAFQLKL